MTLPYSANLGAQTSEQIEHSEHLDYLTHTKNSSAHNIYLFLYFSANFKKYQVSLSLICAMIA